MTIRDKLKAGRILNKEERQKLLSILDGNDLQPDKVKCSCCDHWRTPWDDPFFFCPNCLPREEMVVPLGEGIEPRRIVPNGQATYHGVSKVAQWEEEWRNDPKYATVANTYPEIERRGANRLYSLTR